MSSRNRTRTALTSAVLAGAAASTFLPGDALAQRLLPATHDWSGFYAGVSLGGGTGQSRLIPLRSPAQTTTTGSAGGCQTSSGLFPIVGDGFLSGVRDSAVLADGTKVSAAIFPAVTIFPASVSAFNIVPTGPVFLQNRVLATPPGGGLTIQGAAVQVQPFAVIPGRQVGAVTADSIRPDGTEECFTVARASQFVGGTSIFLDLGGGDFPTDQNGTIVPGTTSTTGLSGPLGRAVGVDAATMAALAGLAGRRLNSRLDGIVGGGQAGFNYQLGGIVLGVEADIQGTDQNGRVRLGGFTESSALDWFGTVRGRLGLAYDRLLVYSTGGFAYGDVSLSYQLGGASVRQTRLQSGWTAGSGVEYALTEQVSLKAEYKHIDLGQDTYFRRYGYDAKLHVEADTVVAGLNYKF